MSEEALPITFTYYRSQGGFRKGFSFYVDNSAVAIVDTFGEDILFRWWFKDIDGIKTHIDWSGINDVDGDDRNQFYFDVPYNFFNKNTDYDCNIECYQNDVIILHNLPPILIKILEPAGTTADT